MIFVAFPLGEKEMKRIAVAFAGFALVASLAHAGERLDADAVKALITDKSLTFTRASDGGINRNYFSPDGKIYRLSEGTFSEGTWNVTEDGKHCVEGVHGGCAFIESNGDGTYGRVHTKNGKLFGTWTNFTNGKDL